MEENFKHCTKTMLHLRMWLDTHPYPGQASVAGLPRAVIMPYHAMVAIPSSEHQTRIITPSPFTPTAPPGHLAIHAPGALREWPLREWPLREGPLREVRSA